MDDAARGRFTLYGRTVDFQSIAKIDWEYRHPDECDIYLWRAKLGHLEVVHSLLASGDAARLKTASALINSFADNRSFASSDAFATGWSPYGASHRLLAILSGLSLAIAVSPIPLDIREDVEAFLQLDAGFLWQNIEHELRNNHTERNLAALCLYHMAAGSVSDRQARALDRKVRQIIVDTLLADGMQVERSAMYQGLTVMSLKVFAACPFLSRATQELAHDRAEFASQAWLFMTHRNGEIALFNDSWLDEMPSAASVLKTTAFNPVALPDAGYFRVTSGVVESILDAGEIGPHCSPAHGHADFLSVEMDVEGHRFIVDPGTSQYSTGRQRAFERSAESHNGPRYQGVEPVEYFGTFRVGKLNRTIEPIDPRSLSALSVPASGGRLKTAAGTCSRVICAVPSGGILVFDYWDAAEKRGLTSILIPGGWELDVDDVDEIHARSLDVETKLGVFRGRTRTVGPAIWSRRYMQTETAHLVALEAAVHDDGTQQLAFGVGVVRRDEVGAVCAEVEQLLRG